MNLQKLMKTLPGQYCRFYREPNEYLVGQDENVLSRLKRFIKQTDDIGIPKIQIENWKEMRGRIPNQLAELTEQNSILHNDVMLLRGRRYYSGYLLADVKDRYELDAKRKQLHKELIESYSVNERLIEDVSSKIDVRATENELPLYSLFDHQKRITLTLLKSVYRSMFREGGDRDVFDGLLALCAETTGQFYRFLVNGEISETVGGTELLEDTVGLTDLTAGDWWRELDDSAKIALYCLNASHDMDEPCELIINPFSGATELGFAFKAVGDAIGKNLVNDIILLNYSKYGEGHTLETSDGNGNKKIKLLLEIGFPSVVRWDAYAKLFGRESLILDDNTTTGSTLRELKDALMQSGVCESVDIGAVELGRLDSQGRFDPNLISELRFEPLGDRMRESKKRAIIIEALFSK